MADQPTPTTDSYVFPRDLTRRYPVAVRADGIRIYDADGREYIDAASGAVSVVSVGHGRRDVADAIAHQALTLPYVFSGEFTHEPVETLARRVAAHTPAGVTRSIWVSGGSEAVETAIKLARNYHVVRGAHDKSVIVSRRRSYHGSTLTTLAVSDVPARKAPYTPYLDESEKTPAPYLYRIGEHGPDGEPLYGDPQLVDDAIRRVGADRVSCFIAEPIVAAAGPGITPPAGYYEAVRAICDAHDVVFIVDEIVTGFGRTGRWFGIDHWDAVPDIMVVAKGIAGGYAPLAGVLAHQRIADAFITAGESFTHGFTYQAHPVSCAAGCAVLDVIERERLVENAATVGRYLHAELRRLADSHPIGDVRGRGLLAGVELVADAATRRPYPPTLRAGAIVCAAARDHGLLVYPGVDAHGGSGDAFLVTPPLVTTTNDVDVIIDRLDQAFRDARRPLAAAGVAV
jgi:adenosylmethionine-8-amino-7-oxononanoate aminotransferase